MTFPHDQIREEFHPEEHSPISIAIVSVVMIAIALALLIAVV